MPLEAPTPAIVRYESAKQKADNQKTDDEFVQFKDAQFPRTPRSDATNTLPNLDQWIERTDLMAERLGIYLKARGTNAAALPDGQLLTAHLLLLDAEVAPSTILTDKAVKKWTGPIDLFPWKNVQEDMILPEVAASFKLSLGKLTAKFPQLYSVTNVSAALRFVEKDADGRITGLRPR